MKRYKIINLLFIFTLASLILFNPGCSKDNETTTAPESVNEAAVLAKYLEDNGDFINTAAPKTITAQTVYENSLVSGSSQYIIDLRSQTDFETKGHIEGAERVDLKDIVTHYNNNNLGSYTTVVITCYSGQTASYATALLQLLGHSNVSVMLFGMSAWNQEACNSWQNGYGNQYATQFTTEATAKNQAGELPTLSTGKTTGAEILEARVTELLSSADPFGDVKLSSSSLFSNLGNYYIVNYWSLDHYNTGHIPGAVQYTPKTDFKLDASLKTLPTDKTVVVYCYTGTTSAHIAAFLKVLGYDAKTLLFGTNGINYDSMPGKKFDPAVDAHDYPVITGP